MLAIIEAHCRFAAGLLPRGKEGCATAFGLLAAFPGACGRNLPDVTGTTPGVFAALVRLGVLPAVPSRRVRLAAIRLLAAVTPMVELRSPRQWSLWFAQALDPGSTPAQRLQASTPESQRAVRDPGETFSPPRARDPQVRRELLREAEAARADADTARAALEQTAAALEEARQRAAEQDAALAAVQREAERQRAAELTLREADQRELEALRQQREADHAQLQALRGGDPVQRQELDRLRAQRETDRQELARVRQQLAAMNESHAKLSATIEPLREEVGVAARTLAARDTKLRAAEASVARLEPLLGAAQRDLAAVGRTREELATARAENRRLSEEATARQSVLADRDREIAAVTKRANESVTDGKLLHTQLDAAQRDLGTAVRTREDAAQQLAAARAETRRLSEEATGRQALIAERDRQIATLTRERGESIAEGKRLRALLEKETDLRRSAQTQHHDLWETLEGMREAKEGAEKKVAAMRELYLRRTAEVAVWKGFAPPIADSVVQQQVEASLARHRARGDAG